MGDISECDNCLEVGMENDDDGDVECGNKLAIKAGFVVIIFDVSIFAPLPVVVTSLD